MDAQWIPITKLKPGDKAVIRSFSENNSDGDYLMELGLMIGTTVTMIKFAPLGDPLQIKVRGFFLSIRRSEAKSILVEKIEV